MCSPVFNLDKRGHKYCCTGWSGNGHKHFKRSIQTVTKVFEKEILVESCFAIMKTLCSAVTEEKQQALPLMTSVYILR